MLDELLNIEKLCLPLGDSYKKELPQDLAYLKNLTVLIVIARCVKDVPKEIYHLPNLKNITISIDYRYKICDKSLQILIDNGCQDIRINRLIMSTNNVNVIRDLDILEYLQKNKLFITSKEFGISCEDLYYAAKQIAFDDETTSKYMISFLNSKYSFGYDTYIAAKNGDENSIDNTINFIELDYEMYSNHKEYVDFLLEIGFSIVDTYPFKAMSLYHSINNTYEIIGSLPCELCDLSKKITYSIAKNDIKQAIEYLNIIDIGYDKLYVLKKIRDLCDEKEIKKVIDGLIQETLAIFDDYQHNVKVLK